MGNDQSAPLTIIDTVGSRSFTTMQLNSMHSNDFTVSLLPLAATIPTQVVAMLLRNTDLGDSSMAKTHALQPWVKQSCAEYSTAYSFGVFSQYNAASLVSFGDDMSELNDLIAYSDLSLDVASGQSRSGLPFVTLALPPDDTSSSWYANETLSWFALDGIDSYHSSLMVHAQWDHAPTGDTLWPAEISGCVVDAYWYDTPIIYSGTDGQVATDLSVIHKFPEGGKPIIISPEWADALARLYRNVNPSIALEVVASQAAPMLALGMADASDLNYYLSKTPNVIVQVYFERGLNDSYVEEWLTSTQYNSVTRFIDDEQFLHHYNEVWICAFDDWTDASSLTQYVIKHPKTGYGYDTSTVPVQLSLTVLSVYVLIVVVHTFYTLVTGRTATSWDSIGEVVMLALNSRQPEHIKGCSVGVGTLSTYGKPMNIRIHSKKNDAEMIFDDDPGVQKNEYRLVEPNERY